MIHLIPVPLSILLITVYTIARTGYKMNLVRFLQPLMSLLVILIALLSFTGDNVNPGYTWWITSALIVAFITDIFHIDMRKDNILIIGIAGFSIAYLIYPIAITVYNGFHWQDILTAIPLLAIIIITMKFLWKGLGNFRIPAMIYSLICPLMVNRAVSTFFGTVFTPLQAVMLTLGTFMVYLADMEYGFHRFYKPRKFLFGHILYGCGQLLIALSCSYF